MTIYGIHISLVDLAYLAAAILGAGSAWLKSRTQLPAGARKWLAKLSSSCVTAAIEQAEAYADLSPDERRVKAVAFLQDLSKKELGFPVPTSVANLLVEFVYQTWKKVGK